MSSQKTEEDVTSTARLLYDLTAQMASFGPVLATKMSISSTLSLPWGLGAAGAETVKQAVDSDNAEGVATMTVIMVKLGMLGSVHDIVVSLCAQDRADAVALVTGHLLNKGEVAVVTRISNALVASEHTSEAVSISGELISQGNVQIYEVIKESGLDMGLLKGGGDDKEGTSEPEGSGGETGGSQPGILESIQHQGAQVLEKIKPHNKEPKKTPDADALFSDVWSGEKKPQSKADEPEEVPPKEDRLL